MSNDKANAALPKDRRNQDSRSPVSCKETDRKKQAKLVCDVKASNKTEETLLRKVALLTIFIIITRKLDQDILYTILIHHNNHTSNYLVENLKYLFDSRDEPRTGSGRHYQFTRHCRSLRNSKTAFKYV